MPHSPRAIVFADGNCLALPRIPIASAPGYWAGNRGSRNNVGELRCLKMLDANMPDKTSYSGKASGWFGNGTEQSYGQSQLFGHYANWFHKISIVG